MTTAWFAANELILASAAPFAAGGAVAAVVDVAATGSSCAEVSMVVWFSVNTPLGAGRVESRGFASSEFELL
jgi:hypothetical protein